jgi:RHS repeat-associated protein
VDKGNEQVYYVYDAGGQRVRKVAEKNNGTLIEERIYLGGFEIFRRLNGAVTLERETLHIMDDKQRIMMIETRTSPTTIKSKDPIQLISYQIGNHLGSASLELDPEAQVISYEEYYPYGSTSYQAVRKDIEVPIKRYRYTGKERDEETGLNYHGARYYAPWLGSWTSCDPAGVKGGTQAYCYAFNNPISFRDPDGKFPAPYEMADAWEKTGVAPIPGVTGEKISQTVSNWGDKIGEAIEDAGEASIERVGIKNEYLKSAIRLEKALEASLVKSVFDVAGGIVAATADPGIIVRGVMRFGTGIAQGWNDIQAGNTVLGVSRIVGEGAQGVGMALGGVASARTLGIPGTYQPAPPPPTAPPAATATAPKPLVPATPDVNTRVKRAGPKGVDPLHHNANKTSRDASGNIIVHERIVSGNMTPEEKALKFPLGPLASHTEARGVKNKPPESVHSTTITGQKPPCSSCKGKMNRATKETGIPIKYQWREKGRTNVWHSGKKK